MLNYSPWQLENIRQRLNPSVRDVDYLVLNDLRVFLQRYATKDRLIILDYGAGNSPYASLFPNGDYRRADFLECVGMNYKLNKDSILPVPNDSFDLVLSTQVAEHLPNPKSYFSEAFRVLKPGGRMVVTTHGIWEDHGVPFDFQRWTADGLRRDLEAVGFFVTGLFKMTTCERFYLFLMLKWLDDRVKHRTNLFCKVWRRVGPALASLIRPPLHYLADRLWGDCVVVDHERLGRHKIYCVVAAEVMKPALR